MKKLLNSNLNVCFICFSLSIYSISSYSQTPQQIFDQSINYLIDNQCDSTIEGKQYKGEWDVFMNLTEPYLFIGKKQKARDSNCFNVAAVHNFLSEIYLKDTSLVALRPVLSHAFNEIQTYSADKRYNFWKLLPPTQKLRLIGKDPDLKVHRPTNYQAKTRLINKASNVPEDADDTSLANLSVLYHNQIFGDSVKMISQRAFDEYLDKNRKNRNWYNYLLPLKRNSGAYLTWHHLEYQHTFWNPISAYCSLLFIFTPFSSAYPEAYQPWIPFGANDVDVVVNANVLNYLALSKKINKSEGKTGAIKVIEYSIEKNKWQTAGNYYPNNYSIDFAVAKAYRNGVEELKYSAEKIAQHILSTQKSDGSFESKYYVNHKDIIQSTAYALHAMLDLKEKGIEIPNENIKKAFEFLFSKAIFENNTCHWEGGVYFSGGTLLRNILIWQSDAYTTALIAKSIQRYYF